MKILTYDETTQENNFGIPEDMNPRRFTYQVLKDNRYRVSTSNCGYGTIVRYAYTSQDNRYMFSTERTSIPSPEKAGYLIDDGLTVTAYYVTAFSNENTVAPLYPEGHERRVVLSPISVGLPIGPRRFYHMRITPDPQLCGICAGPTDSDGLCMQSCQEPSPVGQGDDGR